MNAKVLIIEPDPVQQMSLQELFVKASGHHVKFSSSFYKAVGMLVDFNPDIVILNYLSDAQVLEEISEIREHSYAGIIVMVPALTTDEKTRVLTAGADALIEFKATSVSYLNALINRLFIRVEQLRVIEGLILSASQSWKLSKEKWLLVSPTGKQVKLTGTEYILLEALQKNATNAVSREKLSQCLGRLDCENYEGHINTVMCRLRKKVADKTGSELDIQSFRGQGYCLNSPMNILN